MTRTPLNTHPYSEEWLAGAIGAWFDGVDVKKRNFWVRNKVGAMLKERMRGVGHWKNAARGNPKAGYRAARLRSG